MQQPEDPPLPKKVAVIYSHVERGFFATDEEYISEEHADVYAQSVAAHINKMGIDAIAIPCDIQITERLKKFKPDMVVNLVDSVWGQANLASSVIGLFELLKIPYTGAGILGTSIGTNKFLMYQLLQANGIPVPNHQLVTTPFEMIDPALRYPLFPKLNLEHSSIGIDAESVCENEKALRAQLKKIMSKYNQPVLIDEFIAGMEVTAAVLDGANTKVYPVTRSTGNETKSDVITFEKKWISWSNIQYEKCEVMGLKEYVKKAFHVLKMSDYGRIDIRVDASGRCYFIDPNSNPFFGPIEETHSSYTIILDMYGVDFSEVLRRIFTNTMRDTKFTLPVGNVA